MDITKGGLTHQEKAGISFQVLQFTEQLRNKGTKELVPDIDNICKAASKALVDVLGLESVGPTAPTGLPQIQIPEPGPRKSVDEIRRDVQTARATAGTRPAGV